LELGFKTSKLTNPSHQINKWLKVMVKYNFQKFRIKYLVSQVPKASLQLSNRDYQVQYFQNL